MSGLQK
jgi:hypothetical protein